MRVQHNYVPHHTHTMTEPVSESVHIRGTEEDGTVSECEHCGGRFVKSKFAAMIDPMLNDACTDPKAYERIEEPEA